MAVETDSANFRLPPPFIYVGALLLGLAAERFVIQRSFGIDWRLLVVTGALLFVAGTAICLWWRCCFDGGVPIFRRRSQRPSPQ